MVTDRLCPMIIDYFRRLGTSIAMPAFTASPPGERGGVLLLVSKNP